ncbi:MAG: hypothetical protein JRM76_06365 [Nitrososphaerota archaeon]|nr:hypothetical protein [Nitrososphaerota archaeon]MDG6992848.1 hypothetical protein [Nitrososphaerota archaeon]MDG7029758.1 hypothetical protein [Nitrososphaerota archaeon]MDG7032051.1 hypothetical protein [Nitrososphaerota archaeon]MDG7033803.1 hypothetical protein [Nitrososphaerota archaeon]
MTFDLPTGSYASGATVSASITPECGASARWQLTDNGTKIAGATKPCAKGAQCLLYASSPPSPGSYVFSVTVDSGHQVSIVSESSSFTVAAGQSATSMIVVAAAGFALVVAVATKDEWSAAKVGRGPETEG